jgi:phosphoenolpyruvate---glycerone phosphotransferase subunit DhaL
VKDSIAATDMPALLKHLAADIERVKSDLTELDAAIGDGDLGRTLSVGFDRLGEISASLPSGDIGASLVQCGMEFNEVASSTFGTLLSAAMLQSGKVVRGQPAANLKDLVAMGRAAVEVVQKRGKARPGDKTMLDAMIPAVEALASAHEQGKSLPDALAGCASAARHAAEESASLKSQTGRAGWFGERTRGHKDPGAVAITEILDSVARFAAGG